MLSVTTTICVASVTAQNISQFIAQGDDTSVLQFLTNHGNIGTVDYQGNSLLHIAVRDCPNSKMVKFLIERGADVNAANNEGVTPLGLAITNGRSEDIVDLLLESGADMDLFDNSGLSIYGKAKTDPDISDSEIVDKLDSHRAKYGIKGKMSSKPENWENLIQNGNTDILKVKFQQQKWNPNSRTASGDTLLILAVKKKNIKVVETLLACGANINAPNREGKTALHIAVELSYENIVRTLLNYGADLNLNDNSGRSAYIYAAANKTKDPDMFELLDSTMKNPQQPMMIKQQPAQQMTQKSQQPMIRQQGQMINQGAQQQMYQKGQPVYQQGYQQQIRYPQQNMRMNPQYQGNVYYQQQPQNGYYMNRQQPQQTEKQQQQQQKTKAISGIANALISVFAS